jgi:UDP-GlcNAc3NAcA epimerase
MIKILTIVGARPQFIKAAPVSRAILEHNKTTAKKDRLQEIILHSGQHFDKNMSEVFFNELNIPAPQYNLGVQGGSHGAMTGRMLEKIEAVLLKENPDLVIVYGDTNTTLAGALAASKLNIKIAHIEAGLRSWNRQMPEEINRILTDHLSDILFCPTFQAVENLKNEGIKKNVFHTGDVMFDAALQAADLADKHNLILKTTGLVPGAYFLATLHRAENTDNQTRLRSILSALNQLSLQKSVVLPVHPRTIKKIKTFGLESLTANLKMIDPVSFLEMVALEKSATLILTDSGGVQKEAYFHGIPCITLRDETEWTETVEKGWNVLAGCDVDRILEAAKKRSQGTPILEYGIGTAAPKIVLYINRVIERP